MALKPEERVQAEVVARLRLARIRFFHPFNEGKVKVQYRGKQILMGLEKGVPDLWIITPPPAYPHARGAVLELKSDRGRKPDADQQGWLDYCASIGWIAGWAKGTQAALETLREWGYAV